VPAWQDWALRSDLANAASILEVRCTPLREAGMKVENNVR
jgi:hypothetical protein